MYRPSHRPSFRFRMFPSPFARLFGMVSTSFANEQYRKQQRKAIGKPNCYQKVIICAGCPIFVYGDAIFALPEAFFFGYSGAIFERSRSPFHCLVQNKHSTRSVYEASEAMLIFVIMGGQWMDGFFGEPSARAVNSPPPSCYKDSIEQVAPAMPRARHEPN